MESRMEEYLNAAISGNTENLPKPISRIDFLLCELIKTLGESGASIEEVEKIVTDKVAEIVASAPEDFNTLKEISDWIYSHEDSAAAMNTAIQTNANSIESLNTKKANKSDVYTKTETESLLGNKIIFYDGAVNRSTSSDSINCWVKIAECEAPNTTRQIMDEITLYPVTIDSSVKTTCKVRVEGKGGYANTWKLYIIDSTKDFNSNNVKLIYDKNIVDDKRKIELWGYNTQGWDGFRSQKTFGNENTLTVGLKCLTSQNKFATTYLHDNFAEAPTIDISIKSLVNEGLTSLENDIAINRTTLGTQCKNLLKNNAATKTVNGVTFTVNDDKSITVDGTATARIIFLVGAAYIPQSENYIYTGTPSGGASSTYSMNYRDRSSVYKTAETGSGITAQFEGGKTYEAVIDIRSGVTVSNLTFYPMLRYADITDDTYEEYHETVDERILENKFDIAVNKTTLGYQRKNLFNETEYLSSITSVSIGTFNISGNSITLTATGKDCYTKPHASGDGGYRIPVNPDTDYILSWESDNSNDGYIYAFMNGSLSQQKLANNKDTKYFKFTTKSDTTFITIGFGVSNSGDSITYSNIMLRYADITDSTYEPYQPSVQEQISALISRIEALENNSTA